MNRADWEAGFWRRVIKLGAKACWRWTGSFDRDGYGQLKRADGKTTVSAHRVSAELKHGVVIPGHLVVMHTCDNPGCVNPAHLKVATQRENVLDMHRKGRAPINIVKGDQHGATKISDAALVQLRELWAERSTNGITQQKLAEMYGVTQAQISRIVNAKRRK